VTTDITARLHTPSISREAPGLLLYNSRFGNFRMQEIVIRPSMKPVRAGYSAVFLLLFLSVLTYTNNESFRNITPLILLPPALLLILPVRGDIRRRSTRVVIGDAKLRFESGIFNKSIQTIQIGNIQQVRVTRTFQQRFWGTGNVSIETVAGRSDLTMYDFDDPEDVADTINSVGHAGLRKGKQN
jgi:membrane protein YdbS with pleckstrin-like domain